MTITSVTTKKVAVAVLGLAMLSAVAFALPVKAAGLTESQIQSILSLLSSFGADQSVITNVNSSLRGQATTGGTTTTTGGYNFAKDLQIGSTGADVKALQQLLNKDSATQVAASGAGSPGNETSTFGPATKAAVIKFQTKNSISPAVGYVGPKTRASLNSMGGTTGTTTGGTTPTTPVATGTGLSVAGATQPNASLAPDNATRIPFTKFMVTAGSDGDVVMNSVTVERTGLANNAAFSGVILIDENGNQLGIEKTLNSNNQATVGEAVTIPRGQTRIFTIAANRADTGTYAGQVASFSVIAVNTTATVSGSLPIVGASHTINESLAIGSVTVSRGTLDPGSSQTKEVGTTNYTFSSVKVTAGSAEEVYYKSIRWNQTGSAGSGDVANVKTIVDGTEYPTTVSADGKYYSTVFPGEGLLIAKGASKDLSIKGDIVGGSNRTIAFDLAKRTDMFMLGKTFGYGIKAPAGSASGTNDSAFHSTDDPWYDAAVVTVSAGTMSVSSWTAVSSQNVAENLLNQVLGGFTVDVKGEPITVGTLKFGIGTTTTATNSSSGNLADITNITIVDENGKVLAGPVDGSDTDNYELVSFSDSVTFPIGITRIMLKAKFGTDFDNGDTFGASTTPSGWGSVTGQATGNTITPSPSSTVTSGSTMTLKSGALTVSVSSVPIAQTVIAGSSQFQFANYIFDGTASGEDVRVTSIPLYYSSSGTATDLTNCKLYDGATVLNSSNIKNPSSHASSTSFVFDGTGLVVPKGTSKTIGLKCDIKSGTTSAYWWGIDAGQNADFTGVSGVTSGQTIAETFTDANGQVMTASAGGTLSVAADSGTLGYRVVGAGATGVELGRIRFSAANEDINLRQVALVLSSDSAISLVNREVKLYTDAGTLIGTAVFPTGTTATSSQISNFLVPRDGSKVLVIKGDLAGISNSGPVTSSGTNLIVNYDTNNESGTNGTYGVGVSSGSNTVPTTGAVTAPQGVRIMNAYPTLERLAVPSNTLLAGENKLYRFKVTAVDGDVAIYKMSFNVSSSTVSATTTSYAVYAYTDSGFSAADTAFSATGLVNANSYFNGLGATTGATAQVSAVDIYPDKSSATTTYIVPAGTTRWFEFRATASSVETSTSVSESITVKLLGDAAYETISAASGADDGADDSFIWSPISTTTQNTIYDLDFTNGYQLSGLPSDGMTTQTFSSTN